MVKLSDMIKGDKNTLYFIGNGFDLFHKGVKSKFIHFYSWLNLKDEEHEQFASKMESIFPHSGAHGNWLWPQFEEALGKFNIDQVHTTFAGKERMASLMKTINKERQNMSMNLFLKFHCI